MSTGVQIVAHEGIDEPLVAQVRRWANEVLERRGLVSSPPHLSITIWETVEKLHAFYREEKEELGVVTGEETDFLATHEAWRGYPRIHICQERLRGIPAAVVQGAVQHEIGHALHHGRPEFYTFRFSGRLQEVARSHGLDFLLLQQCIYLLSVAIKDREVVQWLGEIGLGFSQVALLQNLISDTEEERRIWEMISGSPGLRKIALASFLKTLLPIESMISVGIEGAQPLRDRWNEAYAWLPPGERECLFRFAQSTTNREGRSFQDRLEQAALRLIADP